MRLSPSFSVGESVFVRACMILSNDKSVCELVSTAMVLTAITDICNSQLVHNYITLLCMKYVNYPLFSLALRSCFKVCIILNFKYSFKI